MTSRVIDGKSAMSELVHELDRTRRDLAQATLALSSTEATSRALKEALAQKDKLATQLQQELVERDASHRLEVAAVAQGSDAHQQVATHKTQLLEGEVARLRREVATAGEYVTQNQQLREILAQCHETMAELQKANAELRAQMADEVQTRTQTLEDDFSRRLVESERRLRQDAFNALSAESKAALAGNDQLQTVLQRQNETLDGVLERCRHLEAAQSKIEEERRLVESDASGQAREIGRLQRVLGDAGDRATQLEDALKQRRVERASFELLFVEHNSVKEQLAKEREKSRRAVREATRWRDKAFALTEQMAGDEQKDAVAKLQAISQHSELLERNAERNRKRRDKLAVAKTKNAKIAQSVAAFDNNMEDRPAPDSDDNDGEDHEDDNDGALVVSPLPPREQKLQVNPLDILAIWNVNYESEDAGYYFSGTGGGGDPSSSQQQQQQPTASKKPPPPHAPSHSPAQALPPILRTDAERVKADARLSVNAAPKQLPHNVRRLKESAQQQQVRSQRAKEAFALQGFGQATPPLS